MSESGVAETTRRSPRPRAAAVAAIVVLLGVATALAVSIVDARQPLDSGISRSFAAVAPGLAARDATATAFQCQKTSVDFYNCPVAVWPQPRRGGPVMLRYRVWLTDNGCWTARRLPPVPPAFVLRRMVSNSAAARGCLADAKR
jgi:hypothetical protein